MMRSGKTQRNALRQKEGRLEVQPSFSCSGKGQTLRSDAFKPHNNAVSVTSEQVKRIPGYVTISV
jgi:hypothetical protein